jgi:transposase InsO family protein
MSLSSAAIMSRINASSTVTDDASSGSANSAALKKFPNNGHEKTGFANWTFLITAALSARELDKYLRLPIINMPEEEDHEFIINDEQRYLGVNSTRKQLRDHHRNSKIVYNLLIQSLHPKQIELVRNIHVGNAYAVFHRLKSSYDLVVSSISHAAIMMKLDSNRFTSSDTMPDYLARTLQFIAQLYQQDKHEMSIEMKKYHIYHGLQHHSRWNNIITLIQQIDDGWSLERLQQHLIDEESRASLSSASSLKHNKQVRINEDEVIITDNLSSKSFSVDSPHSSSSSSSHSSRGSFRSRGRGGRSFNKFRPRSSNFPSSSTSFSPAPSSFRGHGRFTRGRGGQHMGAVIHKTIQCHTCGKTGHISSNCYHNPTNTITCYTCGKPGHMSSSCWNNQSRKRTHDDNSRGRFAASSSSATDLPDDESLSPDQKRRRYSSFVVISPSSSTAFHSLTSKLNSSEWIIDGGATDHYCYNKNLMTNVRTLSTPRVIVTANSTSTCYQTGTVIIDLNAHHRVVLHNVLYLPDFHVNLISVFKLVSHGCEVTYKKHGAFVTKNGIVEIHFPLKHNMYMLTATSMSSFHSKSVSSTAASPAAANNNRKRSRTEINEYVMNNAFAVQPNATRHVSYPLSSPSSSSSTTSSLPSPSSFNESDRIESSPIKYTQRIAQQLMSLHYKHGHVNHQRLLKMIKKKSVINDEKIHITNEREVLRQLSKMSCNGCLKGKMKRSAMTGKIDYHVTGIMQMLVCDTMLFTIPTIGGGRYISLIVDVYSSETFIGVHAKKDDIAEWIILIIKRLQTSTGITLIRFHSDQGTEIWNASTRTFFDSQGTVYTTSAVDTAQHNAIVERKNQTVITTCSAMMHHAKAYLPFYGEAAACTVYIINRTTNTRTELVTPIQHRTHTTPNTSHFHVWGCDVDYHIHKQYRDNKFAARSKPGIFVGYDEHNERYYRVFELEKHTIITTHEVTFHDDRFDNMKRLRRTMNEQNDESYYDEEIDIDLSDVMTRMNKNDYLPDEYVTSDAIADMFGDEQNNNEDNEYQVEDEEEERRVDMVAPVTMLNDSVIRNARDNEARPEDGNDDNENEDFNEETEIHEDADYVEENEKQDMNVERNKKMNVNKQRQWLQRRHINHARYPRRVTAQPFRFDDSSYTSIALDEPTTYIEAITGAEREHWLNAIKEELDAHEKNRTWSVIKRRKGANVIGCKWVFKKKRDANGEVSKYKARLVAKGFNQQHGIDYQETFAPVMKYKSLRMILALATTSTHMEQLDVKTAFLNASVKEDIYVNLPDGIDDDGDSVLKLNKALYGIKQAPREWHSEIDTFLHSLGYTSCRKDSCLYKKQTRRNNIIIIGLFVDDIISSVTTAS